jgi:hypothetical protein
MRHSKSLKRNSRGAQLALRSPGLVECAQFPGWRPCVARFNIDSALPTVLAWLDAMRGHPVFAADRKRTATFLKTLSNSNHELQRIFYSGDRIEWLLSRGFHDWFLKEIQAERVAFPE